MSKRDEEEPKMTAGQRAAYEKLRRDILVVRGEACQVKDLAIGLYIYEHQFQAFDTANLKALSKHVPALQKKLRECGELLNKVLENT